MIETLSIEVMAQVQGGCSTADVINHSLSNAPELWTTRTYSPALGLTLGSGGDAGQGWTTRTYGPALGFGSEPVRVEDAATPCSPIGH